MKTLVNLKQLLIQMPAVAGNFPPYRMELGESAAAQLITEIQAVEQLQNPSDELLEKMCGVIVGESGDWNIYLTEDVAKEVCQVISDYLFRDVQPSAEVH